MAMPTRIQSTAGRLRQLEDVLAEIVKRADITKIPATVSEQRAALIRIHNLARRTQPDAQ